MANKRAKTGAAKAKPGKGNGKAKAKPAKPTPEQLSDREQASSTAKAVREMRPLIANEKEAKRKKDAEKKKWEAAGVPWKDILFWISLDDEEKREAIVSERERQNRIARYRNLPLGAQMDMGFEKQTAADRAWDQGHAAAMNDQPCKPPAELSQAGAQSWMSGWHVGHDKLTEKRGEGFKPLGAVVGDIVERAKAEEVERAGRGFRPEVAAVPTDAPQQPSA